ncbi:aminoglycoside phosphotransferase family protein [Kitasatospora xanthocidica]|uniref:Aminoglycoside phosphotransferase family protein n=1 Tax=Kitasatospora xanthocidica TaxID=83382 RepID=A0A373A5J8_9ACTN|nr:phosphotransferase [Kitasatospora xanthocidica]RGD62867.1 aminoglycoside phosphotransferase family protein [Kitasatospora xanthocidica]
MSVPVVRVGGFAEAEVVTILNAACDQVGLDPTGAVMLRGHTNAVYTLPAAGAVAKIARAGTPLESVRRTVRLVQWLTSKNFPTVELLPMKQPVVVGGHAVTFWHHLPQPDRPVPAAHLAVPLRMLHELPLPPFDVRPVDTAGAIRRSIAKTTALPPNDVAYLERRLTELEDALRQVRYVLPPGLSQGDPQHRNALHHEDSAVLCDWDTACFGQPELDLVTVEIHCRRFGYGRAHYQEFADAYGFDVTSWQGYPALCSLRELRMITTNAKRASAGSPTIAEVRHRIQGLRSGHDRLEWNIL